MVIAQAVGIMFLIIIVAFGLAYFLMRWYEKREYKRMINSRGSYLNDGIWGS